MPPLALDFSHQHPPVPDLVAHDVKAILVYSRVSTPSRAYLDAVLAAGIGVCPIFETAGLRPWNGYRAGVDDAKDAAADLRRIGVPDGVTLYVNMTDAPSVDGHEHAIGEYATGFALTFPSTWRLGAYGPLGALRAAQAGSPRFEKCWAVETWGAPHGTPEAHYEWWKGQADVVLVQMANVPPPIAGTDTNWIIGPLGAWGSENDEMAISDEQMKILGKWMQDQRDVILETLVGLSGDEIPGNVGVLAGWENDTRQVVRDGTEKVIARINDLPVMTGATTNPAEIAAAVISAMGKDRAKDVVDELARRLVD